MGFVDANTAVARSLGQLLTDANALLQRTFTPARVLGLRLEADHRIINIRIRFDDGVEFSYRCAAEFASGHVIANAVITSVYLHRLDSVAQQVVFSDEDCANLPEAYEAEPFVHTAEYRENLDADDTADRKFLQ